MRIGKGIPRIDLSVSFIVQNEVHLSKTGGRDFLFLTVRRYFDLRLIRCPDQQRAGATSRIVHSSVGICSLINSYDFCQNTRNLGRGIELTLALTAFSSKVTHQILISIAKNIITGSLVIFEIKLGTLKNANQAGKLVHHFLTFAKLGLIVKMSIGNNTCQIIAACFRKSGNNFIHFFTDLRVIFNCGKIIKTTALGDGDICIFYTLELVGYIFDEQKCQNVILILRGVHTSAQLITTCPQGAV